MLSDMTSSLPIEYQLEHGTACGNIDDANLVSEPPVHCVFSDNIALPKEHLLCGIWLDASPVTINRLDALLISLDRR